MLMTISVQGTESSFCMSACARVCVCVHMCVFIYRNFHTDRYMLDGET